MNYLTTRIKQFVEERNPISALEVGVGIGNEYQQVLVDKIHRITMIDAYQPYLDKNPYTRHPAVTAICGELPWILDTYNPDFYPFTHNYDLALAIDVIEHLPPLKAEETIRSLCRIAKDVVLFLPVGSHPQTTDLWEMGGDHWQTHRSTWYPTNEIFKDLGFDVELWADFHVGEQGKDPHAIWCTRRKP